MRRCSIRVWSCTALRLCVCKRHCAAAVSTPPTEVHARPSSTEGVRDAPSNRLPEDMRPTTTGGTEVETHDPKSDVPMHYQLLKCTPEMPLADIKIKYLIQCRNHHPEIGGNPDHFIKVAEAYETILKEHGIEVVEGQAFNFGARDSLPDPVERQLLTDEKKQRLLGNTPFLMIGQSEPGASVPEKPFRDKLNIYNLFFRRPRDRPTLPDPTGAHESMEKEEYQLALKRGDDLLERKDTAGQAAMVATAQMWNVREAQEMQMAGLLLFTVTIGILFVLYWSYFLYTQMVKKFEAEPDMSSELSAGTLLPWWGNDWEYEKQVKRLFVDEWRKARQSARRVQTFQEGVVREGLAEDAKRALDTTIFEVSSDRLKSLRQHVEELEKTHEGVQQPIDKVMAPVESHKTIPLQRAYDPQQMPKPMTYF